MAVSASQQFAKSTSLKPAGKLISLAGSVPGERAKKGDAVNINVTAIDPQHRHQITLTKKIAEGGEGAVFLTSLSGYVAKIYKREKITEDRKNKLKLMISKSIRCAGVCFPEAIILNERDEFVGYLMPKATGEELGVSVFQPKLFLTKFPGWTRKDTIQLSLTILEKIKYLNDRNVILGDINPANILVVSPVEVYFVDCDSYQVEGYPCPVGTANFTPPEAQGKDYKTFLRTQEMENFAIATLMFMIMLPGKPPYSGVGGESPEINIKNGNFPYPHSDEDGSRMPAGKWGYIWSHMSFNVRVAFFETFKKGEAHYSPQNRYDAGEWITLFGKYQHGAQYMLAADPMAMDLFPTRLKMRQCQEPGCKNRFVPTESNWRYCSIHEYNRTTTTSINTRQNTRKKICPYCYTNYIPTHRSYCDSCKDKVVKYRQCVNCLRSFPVKVSLDAWEKTHKAERKQCDTCRAARCTESPCMHALPSSTVGTSSSKIQGTQTSYSSSRGGCYIATAVYGSYDHPQTMVLRKFRDEVLAKSIPGRAFIKTYYAISPHLVRLFGAHSSFNAFWRKRLDSMIEWIHAKYNF